MTAPQPLYVDSTAASIRLQGPSLVVTQAARSDMRVPLCRLARVVVRGAVPFATEALLGCLGAGVPVTFVALDGRVLGYCIGPERRVWSTGQLLERMLTDPEWPDVIGRWARHGESEAMVRTCRRMRVQPDLDMRAATVRGLLAKSLPTGPMPQADAVLRRLDGLLRAHLAELLQRADIPSRYRGQEASPLDLRPHFTAALAWHLWPIAARVLDHGRRHPSLQPRRSGDDGPASNDRRRRLVVAYEAAAPMIEAAFMRLLTSLDLLLREQLS